MNSPFLQVESDFLSSLRNIFLFRNFFLFVETGRFNFCKITFFLLIETDFLPCGNHFFSSSLRHSCHCQLYFPSSENVFLNTFWLVEKHFLASGNAFSSIFQSFQPAIVFFSSSGNVVFKRIFHSGQWKRIFQLAETNFFPFLGKSFPVQCKLIFQQILHSGQWKLILWLMETILC